MTLKVASLFSSAGIGESRLHEIDCNVVFANEILENRCNLFAKINPGTDIECSDISDIKVRRKIIKILLDKKVDVIMATPPCQGMSVAGKNLLDDPRNHLITYAIDVIKKTKPKYVFLENVPRQLKTFINYKNNRVKVPDYIYSELSKIYYFNNDLLIKASDYAIPQMRQRNIMLLSRKDQKKVWTYPKKSNEVITLEKAIGQYPSLDPLLREGIEKTIEIFPKFEQKMKLATKFSKWHYPPTHSLKHVLMMQKTPSGQTAFNNEVFYPKRDDGKKVSGHYNHYRRLDWDKPSRSLTQNNGVISSLACVHPGRKIKGGNENSRIYSDARCLSLKEIFTVTSTNFENKIGIDTPENLIRKVIGEGIPPLLVKKIFKSIT